MELRKRFLNYIEKNWYINDHDLKEIPCVYAMAAYDPLEEFKDIVYIGSTINLFLRYKSHKVPTKIQKSGRMNILYYLPMDKGLYDYERKLIGKLKPKYNRQHKNGS